MPVIAKILIDLDLTKRNIGLVILSAGVVDDTVGWLILSLIAAAAEAGAILAGVVGGRSAHGIPPERVFTAIHIGFLAAGLAASGGTILTAARSEGRTH